MIITVCGSMKFYDKMLEAEKNLTAHGHEVLIPIKGVANTMSMAELKIKHMGNIDKSDAILVINISNKDIKNRIGASTFLEIGVAFFKRKKIFFLNPIPDQAYIVDEINIIEPQIINGDYSKVVLI